MEKDGYLLRSEKACMMEWGKKYLSQFRVLDGTDRHTYTGALLTMGCQWLSRNANISVLSLVLPMTTTDLVSD